MSFYRSVSELKIARRNCQGKITFFVYIESSTRKIRYDSFHGKTYQNRIKNHLTRSYKCICNYTLVLIWRLSYSELSTKIDDRVLSWATSTRSRSTSVSLHRKAIHKYNFRIVGTSTVDV